MSPEIKNLLKNIFSSGGVSLMRILTAIVVLDIMSVWTIDCIKSWKIQDIPTGVVGVFIAMVGSKALQVFAENTGQTNQDKTGG
jgi:hypothetical protein